MNRKEIEDDIEKLKGSIEEKELTKKEFKETKQEIQEAIDDFEISEEEYNEILEDCYGENINICGFDYYIGQVLKDVDEIRYNIGKQEEESRVQDELQKLLDEIEFEEGN